MIDVTATTFFIIVAVAWIGIGLATSVVMGRRGHDLFSWGILGAVFGPLVLILVLDSAARERRAAVRRIAAGTSGRGSVDVLAGIDGSDVSARAAREALELLGDRVRRLTLATVVDFEAGTGAGRTREEERTESLMARARELAHDRAELVVLAGRPAEVLVKHALEGEYHLLVIGRKGSGASKAILGSVARRLAADASVPVLIAGG